jgi:hypothetical protein
MASDSVQAMAATKGSFAAQNSPGSFNLLMLQHMVRATGTVSAMPASLQVN